MKARNGLQEVRQIEATLARMELLEGVAAPTLRQLALHTRLLRVRRGQVVLRRGERAAGVFAVVQGSLKTRLQHANGDEVILALLASGSTVGLAASVLSHPSRVDLIALEESLVLLIDAASLSAQMARDPRLARNVANDLATKTQALMASFERSMLPTLQRLADYLQSIAEPTAAPDVWAARLPVSKTVVAARLGMKKETLSRLLQGLARRGVITVAQRDITILNRAGLAQASSDRARGA